jgi:hypothetical protein
MTPMHRPDGILVLAKTRGRNPARAKARHAAKVWPVTAKAMAVALAAMPPLPVEALAEKAMVTTAKVPEAALAARPMLNTAPTRSGTTTSAWRP